MSGLWRSNYETLQFVSNFLLPVFRKELLQSLSYSLDVCKRGSSSLLFVEAQFLSQIRLRIKADRFLWQNDSGSFDYSPLAYKN